MKDSEHELKQGTSIEGFHVERITSLPDLDATAYELRHDHSGARVLHIHTPDTENLFSITLPTPPPDNTGLPHILEHAVLAGSERFPVKEPFFEMIKMSMATFINAMTGPDATYYPVASNVKRDLFNLADVYFDAVFHPTLSLNTFRREAHHLAPQDPEAPTGNLTINGIVYNEMKGAFSNPEACLDRALSRNLFPDTVYSHESGGNPEAIPNLAHEQMLSFHRSVYHPSNARFFLYGDIPTREHLTFLAPRLAAFKAADPQPAIAHQPRWDAPRLVTETYPVGQDETLAQKTYLALSWRAYDATDPADTVLMRLLELTLFGNEGAPLRKALIDSKLGVDLVLAHAENMGCEGVFSIGLKGSEPEHKEAFEACVLNTLTDIASRGFTPKAIDAAFQQAAYHYLEIKTLFPLHVMDNVLQSWLYEANPLSFIEMQQHLHTCRQRIDADPQLLSAIIRERLLNNPHRLSVVLTPDPNKEARTRETFEQRMQQVRAGLSDEAMLQIAADAAELDRENGRPNTPEQVASLPQLAVADLPKTLIHIPTTVEKAGPITLLHNDVPSNGVNTLVLHFNLQGLPERLWTRLSHYAEAISKLGAAGMNYEAIAHRKAACTGGLGCMPSLMTRATADASPVWGLQCSLKTLDDRIEPALDLLHDLLFGVDPRDRERLHDVLAQMLAHCRTDMVHHGNATASSHAARGISIENHLEELLHGLPQLDLAETIMHDFDTTCVQVMADIETLRDYLMNRDRVTASFTGSSIAFKAVQRTLAAWAGNMDETLPRPEPTGFEPFDQPPREGLAAPLQVAHCAVAIPAPHFSHSDATGLTVASHLVSMDYVLNEIRFQGNAYGASFRYSPFHKHISMGSYNDPHITRTLSIFENVKRYVERTQWTQIDIDRAIISTAKTLTRPIRPAAATHNALQRHLAGLTHAVREERYDRLRALTPADARRAMLAALDSGLDQAGVCVISNHEKLTTANRELGSRPLTIRKVLKEG